MLLINIMSILMNKSKINIWRNLQEIKKIFSRVFQP
jgi:hypothetical protein